RPRQDDGFDDGFIDAAAQGAKDAGNNLANQLGSRVTVAELARASETSPSPPDDAESSGCRRATALDIFQQGLLRARDRKALAFFSVAGLVAFQGLRRQLAEAKTIISRKMADVVKSAGKRDCGD